MRISSFRIENYKSFINSGEISCTPGFNIFIGQNNVGKTAFLEAVGLQSQGRPHKSLRSCPTATTVPDPWSHLHVSFVLTGEELKALMLNHPGQYALPILKKEPNDSINCLLQVSELKLTYRRDVNATGAEKLDFQAYPGAPVDKSVRFETRPGTTEFKFTGHQSSRPDFQNSIFPFLRARIYSFRAERLNVGVCPFGHREILKSDASNLAEVLHTLQTNNPVRFEKLNDLIRQVFPSIYLISVRPHPKQPQSLEIVVWTEDPNTERADLAIELAESGTGVGQALAILYVALNSEFPMMIIIDEPNSFLHPGAARKLIEILNGFDQHQYIVSTHSAEIIRAANPNTLTLIRWKKPQSVLEQLDVGQIAEVQKCLVEVGAKLSDVFGADNILWVEGQTEEECYKLLISRLLKRPMLGTSIVAVRNTGDFEGKHASLILDIYSKLSQGNALIPPALAFVFDREGKTDQDVTDIIRRSDGKVRFLPRRTYENYLISPIGLTAVINKLPTFQNSPIDEDHIREWLVANGGNTNYMLSATDKVDLGNKQWLEKVNGAKLLKDCFQTVSKGKEEYRKTVHSVQLTEWLIEHDPDALRGVTGLLEGILCGDMPN